jgi:hypothetical protein
MNECITKTVEHIDAKINNLQGIRASLLAEFNGEVGAKVMLPFPIIPPQSTTQKRKYISKGIARLDAKAPRQASAGSFRSRARDVIASFDGKQFESNQFASKLSGTNPKKTADVLCQLTLAGELIKATHDDGRKTWQASASGTQEYESRKAALLGKS